MGIIDTFAQLILYICYAAYCCVGLILLITTVMYLTEITGGNDFVTIGLGCSGLLMLIIGGVALYANFKQIWLILAVVELFNLVLFALVISAAFIAFVLAMDVRDPIRTGIDTGWEKTTWKENFWNTKYCSRFVPVCDEHTGFKFRANLDVADPLSTYPPDLEGQTHGPVAQLFANCSRTAYAASEAATTQILEKCEECNEVCRESFITHLHDGLEPAFIGVCATFVFIFLAIFANAAQLRQDEPPKIVTIICMVLNGVCSFAGLVMAILAAYGQSQINDDCPADTTCTNMVAVCIGIIGIALFVTGAIGVVGAWKTAPLMVVVNLVLLLLALLLFCAGIFLAVISGAMETVNGKSEKHFDALRKQYEQKNPGYCQTIGAGDLNQTVVPMGNEECRAKISADVESNLVIVGIIALSVASFFGVVIFFTYHCIKAMQAGDADADDEDDDTVIHSALADDEK